MVGGWAVRGCDGTGGWVDVRLGGWGGWLVAECVGEVRGRGVVCRVGGVRGGREGMGRWQWPIT